MHKQIISVAGSVAGQRSMVRCARRRREGSVVAKGWRVSGLKRELAYLQTPDYELNLAMTRRGVLTIRMLSNENASALSSLTPASPPERRSPCKGPDAR